jgi:hypothetical protein
MRLNRDGVFGAVCGDWRDIGRELERLDADDGRFFLKSASDANGGAGFVIEPKTEGGCGEFWAEELGEFWHDSDIDEAGGFSEEICFAGVFGVEEHWQEAEDFAWNRDLHGAHEHGEVGAFGWGDLVRGFECVDEGLNEGGWGCPQGVVVASDLQG